MNHIVEALVSMNPTRLIAAAEELDSRIASDQCITDADLRHLRDLAAMAADYWQRLAALSALNSGGYSASGVPVAVLPPEGDYRG